MQGYCYHWGGAPNPTSVALAECMLMCNQQEHARETLLLRVTQLAMPGVLNKCLAQQQAPKGISTVLAPRVPTT